MRRFLSYLLNSSLLFLIVFAHRVDKVAPVEAARLKSRDHDLGRREVGSDRNIIYVAESEQSVSDVGGLLGDLGASEIEYEVYLVVGDSGDYLLHTAGAAGKEGLYVKTRRIRDIATCRIGCENVMTAENSAISDTELRHKLFFVIVCDDCNIHILSRPFFKTKLLV